ncbi:hypothetical protein NQ317_000062 [Molorchus minor]|uniref:Cuticle protein CPCFC domain-containing protein n=1 Tax=Molorchus minor TaxID=1323400 RepID=A0ABQ9JIB8_9CUCU|nr:hypothetical protein NQ317_000062 [Molorchus minor]
MFAHGQTVIACYLAVSLAAYNGPLAGGLPAAQYPAGVDPKSCPNFPNCANPAVAVSQGPEQYHATSQYQPQQYQSNPQYQNQQYQPIPQYQPTPQYQPQQPQAHYKDAISQYNPVLPQQYAPSNNQQHTPEVQNALNRGEYIGDGDYHGEGLAEALAPGYSTYTVIILKGSVTGFQDSIFQRVFQKELFTFYELILYLVIAVIARMYKVIEFSNVVILDLHMNSSISINLQKHIYGYICLFFPDQQTAPAYNQYQAPAQQYNPSPAAQIPAGVYPMTTSFGPNKMPIFRSLQTIKKKLFNF